MSAPQALLDYLSGNKISDATLQKRKDTCMACKRMGRRISGLSFNKKYPFIFLNYKAICRECGCFLEGALGKWAAPKEKCPLNHPNW